MEIDHRETRHFIADGLLLARITKSAILDRSASTKQERRGSNHDNPQEAPVHVCYNSTLSG